MTPNPEIAPPRPRRNGHRHAEGMVAVSPGGGPHIGPRIELVFGERQLWAVLLTGRIAPELLALVVKLIPCGVENHYLAGLYDADLVWHDPHWHAPASRPKTHTIVITSAP